MKTWSVLIFTLVLQSVMVCGCQSAQNSALDNESGFARVPILLSKKTRIGQEGVAPAAAKSFDYHETYDHTSGGNSYSTEARAIGLSEPSPGVWISAGSQPALRPGEFVQLTGQCDYKRSYMWPLVIILDFWEFHCDARVLRTEGGAR